MWQQQAVAVLRAVQHKGDAKGGHGHEIPPAPVQRWVRLGRALGLLLFLPGLMMMLLVVVVVMLLVVIFVALALVVAVSVATLPMMMRIMVFMVVMVVVRILILVSFLVLLMLLLLVVVGVLSPNLFHFRDSGCLRCS